MSLNWLLGLYQHDTWFALVVYGLATWRISYMFMYEQGPFNIMVKLRERTGIRHDDTGHVLAVPDGNVLGCIYCTSVWVAMCSLILPVLVLVPFAVSTIAILVNKVAK